VADNPRVDELRRRVQQDPASIAFAQLAEEYRRIGELDEAVEVCRAGLAHHPTYLSAHVTLGRALMALDRNEEARDEFEYVLQAAPDNLVALRCLEELGPSSHSASPGPTVSAAEQPNDNPFAEAPRDSEPAVAPSDTVVAELERLLAGIRSDRAERESGEK
jgi:tetratricopeptide (TPR) repeat protein